MRRRLGLCALLACAGTAAAGEPARTAWRALFAHADPGGTPTAMAAVLRACDGDPAKLRRLIAADTAYGAFRPGASRLSVPAGDGANAGRIRFVLRVPRRYDPSRPWPLLLACHGQGGSGRAAAKRMARLLGEAVEEYVLLAPTLPDPDRYAGGPAEERASLRPLTWVRRRLNVDDDRVCVAGYSMGGHHAWHLATMHARLFGAAVPMAGVPRFEGAPYTNLCYLENLANLPVWAIWGERDRPADGRRGTVDDARAAAARLKRLGNRLFTGTELPGTGHVGCIPPAGELSRYLARRRRAVPEAFEHRFHRPHHRRGYYLRALDLDGEAADFSRPLRVRHAPGSTGTQADARQAVEAFLRRRMYRMRATLSRDDNALSVETERVGRLRILVHEGMFDLARPVTIRRDGRSWTGRIAVAAECMLARYVQARDGTALVCNEVDVDRAGRVTVRHR